jgi:drug/metabolite transporter (DMT)-like permease
LGAIILLPFAGKKVNMKMDSRKDTILLFLYGFLGITVNILFFFWGLELTYAINAPVIASAQPILTLFLALFFLKELFVAKKFLGMLLGTAGIIIIVIEPLLGKGIGGSILGNMYLVVATLAAVGATIAGKKIINKYNPWAFTFWAFLIGAASFLPLAAYEYFTIPQLYQHLDWRGYMGIAYGAIFSSAAAYGLFAWGLSKISASDASMFTYVDPIAGTLLAYFMLHEPITSPFLVGSMLIFGGIFLAEGRIHYHPIRKFFFLGKPVDKIPIPVVPETIETPIKHVDKKKVLASIFKKSP